MNRAPDLERVTPDGYRVTVRYLPSLERPVTASVRIQRRGAVVDTLTVPAGAALDAYRHPSSYSDRYRCELAPE